MDELAPLLTWLASHKIQVGTWVVALTIMGIRSLFWLYAPTVTCDTCEHTGKAKRVIRGSIAVELIVLAHGLTIGLIIMEILWVTIIYFLWRTLGSYFTCMHCGSERIARPGEQFGPSESNSELPVTVIHHEHQEKWWY